MKSMKFDNTDEICYYGSVQPHLVIFIWRHHFPITIQTCKGGTAKESNMAADTTDESAGFTRSFSGQRRSCSV